MQSKLLWLMCFSWYLFGAFVAWSLITFDSWGLLWAFPLALIVAVISTNLDIKHFDQ